jgi:CRP/FNR family transcriptional regulator, cyclic AMP receptor protein
MDLIKHFQDETNCIEIAAGRTIFDEGDAGLVMYVLIEGVADILLGGELVERAFSGAIFGEMALIDSAPRSATAIAHSDCRLFSISAQEFDTLIQKTPDFARHVMRVMADRIRNMNRRNLQLMEHALRF